MRLRPIRFLQSGCAEMRHGIACCPALLQEAGKGEMRFGLFGCKRECRSVGGDGGVVLIQPRKGARQAKTGCRPLGVELSRACEGANGIFQKVAGL